MTVRYLTVNKNFDRVVREKSFKTEAAMSHWLDREDNGVVEILCFID